MISKPGEEEKTTSDNSNRLVSSGPQIDTTEIGLKLDSLAANIERLTEIALENRRLINALNMLLANGPQPVADIHGQGFANSQKKEPHPGAETYRDPFSYASGIIPASPFLESEGEANEEQLQEERVKKFEEENPW